MNCPFSRAALVAALVGAVALSFGCFSSDRGVAATPTTPTTDPSPSLTSAPPQEKAPPKPRPAIFPNEKPAAFLVLSGQMYGYLQPCGCSRPQVGGLERRFELVRDLCARGVPVSAADLGDIAPHSSGDQSRNKYEFSIRMLSRMPYGAIGIGITELNASLEETLARAQNYQPPFVLVANLEDKEGRFPEMFRGWTVHEAQLLEGRKAEGQPVRIGYIGLAGTEVIEQAKKIDPALQFSAPAAALKKTLAEVKKHSPDLIVLLFQGNDEEAVKLANDFPEVQVIVNRAVPDIAPSLPKMTGPGQKTMLINLGHKGKSVGVVALNRQPGIPGLALKYQLVDLVEAYELPDDKTNTVRDLMREYVKAVYQNKYLTKIPLTDHPLRAQPGMAEAKYVGAATCQACHPKTYAIWSNSRHAHAYESLEKYGRPQAEIKQPGKDPIKVGRQHDPDCASCHVTGFGYHSGWTDELRTPQLKGNQCENCHGPASLHVANPMDPKYREPLRLKVGLRFTEMKCRKCHDADNDPHFDMDKYWPKIKHGKG
jgi:hypothetical protein